MTWLIDSNTHLGLKGAEILRAEVQDTIPNKILEGKTGKSSKVFFCHVSGFGVEEHKQFLCEQGMKNSPTVMKEPAINGLRGFYISIKVLSASYL